METVCTREDENSRYALTADGQLACVLEYQLSEEAISLVRTFTVPTFRGHGFANVLVSYAIEDIRDHSTRRVVPTCWYVGEWFEKHPEESALLTR